MSNRMTGEERRASSADQVGQRFGLLVVVERADKHSWRAKCDCGGEKVGPRSSLKRQGHCGCLSTLHRSEGHRRPLPAVKRCSSCGSLGPFTKKRGNKDGLDRYCVSCRKVMKAASYKRNKAHVNAKNRAYALSHPGETKARNAAYYQENRESELVKRAAFRLANKPTIKQQNAVYYAANKATILPKNAVYRLNMPDWVRENERASKRRYQREHGIEHRIRTRNRERKKAATMIVRLTETAILDRVSAFGGVCAYCGSAWEHLDHVKPIAKGGPHILSNLRPACAPCNHRKSAKSPFLWLAAMPRVQPLPLP